MAHVITLAVLISHTDHDLNTGLYSCIELETHAGTVLREYRQKNNTFASRQNRLCMSVTRRKTGFASPRASLGPTSMGARYRTWPASITPYCGVLCAGWPRLRLPVCVDQRRGAKHARQKPSPHCHRALALALAPICIGPSRLGRVHGPRLLNRLV